MTMQTMLDNGGRRLGIEKRHLAYTTHIPEERSSQDRRQMPDRRNGRNRRNVPDRRESLQAGAKVL